MEGQTTILFNLAVVKWEKKLKNSCALIVSCLIVGEGCLKAGMGWWNLSRSLKEWVFFKPNSYKSGT